MVRMCHTNPPPTTNPPTMRTSGSDNVFIGYKAGCFGIGSSTPWPTTIYLDSDDTLNIESAHSAPPAPFWHCAYCGQSNAAGREGCRGCQAPKQARAARVRESVTTWKGVPLSRLTEEERDEMAGWMAGPDGWRNPPMALDADMETRVLAAMARPRPALLPTDTTRTEPQPRPINLGHYVWAEQGDNRATQRAILQRIKQFVGLR